jgi:hypothetical protein
MVVEKKTKILFECLSAAVWFVSSDVAVYLVHSSPDFLLKLDDIDL